jgi:3-hydroxyisobutyrate dehydrogenase-like beta-hydroxyacid dehydrogenase
MSKQKVGILHPGLMGISVAASAKESGHDVHWVSEGRSSDTLERATKHDLIDAGMLKDLCEICGVILSVCPPHAAEAVAQEVSSHNYKGLYLDANAISPQRAIRIGRQMTAGGATFVDGSIIGGPAWTPGRTWLYLSGPGADGVASLFSGGPLETTILNEVIGAASSIKMCFAAYSKGTTALLSGILATAETLGVREPLQRQWSKNESDFAHQAVRRTRHVTAKAWRFHGEMDEIADTFREAGLPGGFHEAAADLYRRMAHFKDAPSTPPLEDVLQALIQ